MLDHLAYGSALDFMMYYAYNNLESLDDWTGFSSDLTLGFELLVTGQKFSKITREPYLSIL